VRSYAIVETDLGWVGLMRSNSGLNASTLPQLRAFAALQHLSPRDGDVDAGEPSFRSVAKFVRSLLAGRPCDCNERLDLSRGTAFQQTVWLAVRAIAFGRTRSYGWVAEAIGRPLAAHAVGQAIAGNPLPLFVPCHRVIAASGELGGYGRGSEALPAKRSLLRREGIWFPGPTLEQVRGIPQPPV